jgi:hypothetical protein
MGTHTANPIADSAASVPSADATLGARLAAASRRAQGLATAVDDPAVLAELRGLCTAPRPMNAPRVEKRDGPAP